MGRAVETAVLSRPLLVRVLVGLGILVCRVGGQHKCEYRKKENQMLCILSVRAGKLAVVVEQQ